MTAKQFNGACRRHGFKPSGVLGYVDIGYGVSVSIRNCAKQTRRAWLAYLISMAEKYEHRAKVTGGAE